MNEALETTSKEVPMMRRAILALVACAVVMLGNEALAHHNMTALFDFNDRVTLNGTLTQVDWRNPHMYLTLDVHATGGATESWSAEGPSPTWFRIRDIGKADFVDSVGKSLTLELSRARDHSRSGLIRSITLPSGKVVSACPQNC
jgi:Family of unknown function (DUF6152)